MYNLDVVEFNAVDIQHPLAGDFYLTVEAQSLSTYTIILLQHTAYIDDTPVSQAPTYVMLNDGIP